MATDRALHDFAVAEGAVVMRLYRWSPPCLSFGRHEPATRRYDRARIEALGLECVRRPTGGRAVWHARELTYALAAPESALGGLREAYGRIHAWLAEAVRHLGATASLATGTGRPPGPGAGACFDVPVGGEVTVAGAKVVGSAQLREGGALLQHGSMLLEDDQALVRSLALAGTGPAAPEAPLARLLGRPVTWEDAATAVGRAARAGWHAVEEVDLGPRLRIDLTRWATLFRDPRWTWER